MQNHHHHHHVHQQPQHQLAALLAAALPRDDAPSPSTSSSSPAAKNPAEDAGESNRIAALESLRRAVLHPHNALLVAHFAAFLSQGLAQLLSDKIHSVRRLSAIVYGTLSSVICSSFRGPSGSQNHVIVQPVIDHFISWALPLTKDGVGGNGHAELALEGLREFLSNGDPTRIEGYVLPILKASQQLLEDERTSLSLLHHLLNVMSLISLKFSQQFQPHFVDIVDLLLGWALVSDLSDSDRCVIMDCFLQFKKHWLNKLEFPLGLLSKFLGDMEVMLSDTSVDTNQQISRLLALLSCFSTVLQVIAYGLSEVNLLSEIFEPLMAMLPQFLTCLTKVNDLHGWLTWANEFWKCLKLMGEILGEKFSSFYALAYNALFDNLKNGVTFFSSTHIHGILHLNVELLSVQGSGLQPSSVQKILKIDTPLSQLRLHPNHHVTGATAINYIFLVRHQNEEIAEVTIHSLMEELEDLARMYKSFVDNRLDFSLGNLSHTAGDMDHKLCSTLSELELVALINFDLSILLSALCFWNKLVKVEHIRISDNILNRMILFIFENLCPFEHPVNKCVNLQVRILRILHKLSEVELLDKLNSRENLSLSTDIEVRGEENQAGRDGRKLCFSVIFECMGKYSDCITKALHNTSPLSMKQIAFEWIQSFCETVLAHAENLTIYNYYQTVDYVRYCNILLVSILDAASDKELKVRGHVAKILGLLLQAKLIDPEHFLSVAEVVLDRLGEPENTTRDSFVNIFSIVAVLSMYKNGNYVDEFVCNDVNHGNNSNLQWKQVFALRRLPQQLHSQQVVSVLSYLSQRWKVPLASWIQQLVYCSRVAKTSLHESLEHISCTNFDSRWMDMKVEEDTLGKIGSVNSLAGVWWAIHEAARYFIIARLRTSLGGPAQTFASLERMLLDVAHTLKLESDQSESNLNAVSSGSHLLPMRLLLDFMETLKKNVYNAYEGSCVLPSSPRQSLPFFLANRKVCEEWFSRICEPMMTAGVSLHCHTAVIQYCFLRLQELKLIVEAVLFENSQKQTENFHGLRTRFTKEVLSVLRIASLALCRNHEPEALVGLHKWTTVSFSSLFREENQIMSPFVEHFGHLSWMTGLFYQAQGSYEIACARFSHLLQSEESLKFMDYDGIQFVISRIIENYTALSDWKSLEEWLSELQVLRTRHAGKSFSGALTAAGNEMNVIHALARFDEGDIQSAWAYLDLTPKSNSELTLDCNLAVRRSEQNLLQALMLQRDGKIDEALKETEKGKMMLAEALSCVPLDGQKESAAYAAQLHCIFTVEGQLQVNCQKEKNQSIFFFNSLEQVLQLPINKVHQDCSLWVKIFRTYCSIHPTLEITLNLGHNLMALARKQKNFMMARRLRTLVEDDLLPSYVGNNRELLTSKIQYEKILLMYAEDKHEDALMSLWDLVHTWLKFSQQMVTADPKDMLKSIACMKISKWLRKNSSFESSVNLIGKMCSDICELSSYSTSPIFESNILGKDVHLLPDKNNGVILEQVVGTVTKLSTFLCPSLCKSWLHYASWCYDQARYFLFAPEAVQQPCFISPFLQSDIPGDRFQLTEEEIAQVESMVWRILVINKDGSNAVFEGNEDVSKGLKHEGLFKDLVGQIVHLIQLAAGSPGMDTSDRESPSTVLESQLKFLLSTHVRVDEHDNREILKEIMDIWLSFRRRRLSLFASAAHGFLQYLSHSSLSHLRSVQGSLHHKAANCNLRAILCVLRILSNFGLELKDLFESSLDSVPIYPWQEITPQIFARLSSHPQQVVRNILVRILLMLAKLTPWSIVYPTLVDFNAYEGRPSEELLHIMSCLNKLYPKLIQDVQVVISELGMITVLWEEQWLTTLQDLHADVIRRINLLKEEAARVAENATLSLSEKSKINAARYVVVMSPIIVALERRLQSTSRKAETAYETWFQEEYGQQIKSAILKFKSPPLSPVLLADVWRPFDNIVASLANNHRKSSILLRDIAPQLSLLSSSDVPMPGLERQISTNNTHGGSNAKYEGLVTVSSFGEQVTILSTKTKPKKLALLGSDGHKHTYLLKGREDLRLDARIMQLLQAINGFLHLSSNARSSSLSIRYYSVTPISGQAGLIQWVENVISIYSVFKSWQSRAQLALCSAPEAPKTNNAIPHIPRPSDMFYGKIIPALKEKGIRRVISRKDWPQEVKRKVFLDLMKETPRQLLYNEIWCASEDFRAFRLKLNRFSGSVAAMSMVGHVLGLGDRHLDNIMIDLCKGDIVHIDYNICFDKGKRLKIPEIVPFRLTHTIEAALGLTGIEGTFRSNCEAVVDVLRKKKDDILMLLEVFVWDPLVEWTRGDDHDEAALGGEERKGMELAVSLSLFASRIHEIRIPLQEHHDLLLSTVPAVLSALERFLDVLNEYEVVSSLFFHADVERSNLILREKSAKSLLAEATLNAENSQTQFEVQAHEFSQAKSGLSEKAQDAVAWIEQHGQVIDALRTESISNIKSPEALFGSLEALSLSSAVVTAGVPLTIVPEPTLVQCQDLDREISEYIAQIDNKISCAIKALQEYSLALQRVLPLNYVTSSPVHGWAQAFQLVTNQLSSDNLSLVKKRANDLLSRPEAVHISMQKFHQELCAKVETYAIIIEKIEEECLELTNSIGSGTEEKTSDGLFSHFMKYMQTVGFLKESDWQKHIEISGELEDKKVKMLIALHHAAFAVFDKVKNKVLQLRSKPHCTIDWKQRENVVDCWSGTAFREFEEQVERCVLVAGFLAKIQELFSVENWGIISESSRHPIGKNWVSVFQACLISCQNMINNMFEIALPEIIRSVISCDSEVMEAFGTLSQIRGSVDTTFEQLIEVQAEKTSLLELERSYLVNVGLITEQQLALEVAALKGRDHLSWEEAEELAVQQESCRAQLDKLHQTWSQKDSRSSLLEKKERSLQHALNSAEKLFSAAVNVMQGEAHKGKAILAALTKPLAELESIDKALPLFASFSNNHPVELSSLITSGYSVSDSIWTFQYLLGKFTYFIWKIGIVDSILNMCIHDLSYSDDHNFGFEQILYVLRKKIEFILLESVNHYIQKRAVPAFLSQLEVELEHFRNSSEILDAPLNQLKISSEMAKEILQMLEEYCDAHEAARAGTVAISSMKRQVSELTDAARKTILEIVKMRWLHSICLDMGDNNALSLKYFGDHEWAPIILNLNRTKLLQSLQSAMSSIVQLVDCIQFCERSSISAEGQLERAMGWACGGPNVGGYESTSAKNSGIPAGFYDHLTQRRRLLSSATEKASDIINICSCVLEFEASRDGRLSMPGKIPITNTMNEGRTWQQAYVNALTRLDISYHSFSRTELEWKVVQSNMEAAASELLSATNELSIASRKADSVSGNLQKILATMREYAYEASRALSDYARVANGCTALTSECGPMLEEVLAITESLHDVHCLGKEAATVHSSLMDNISKVNAIILPLESILSADVAALSEAISKEKESKMEISPIHGQALHQSYALRLHEVIKSLRPLAPSVSYSVRELHTLLTQLARTANVHAGNLHKALEGIGESEMPQSQGIVLSRTELEKDPVLTDKDTNLFVDKKDDAIHVLENSVSYATQDEWISPPDGSYISTQKSSMTSPDGNEFKHSVDSTNIKQNGYATDEAEAEVGVDKECSVSNYFVPDDLYVGVSKSQYSDQEKVTVNSEAPGHHLNGSLLLPCEDTHQGKKLVAEGSPSSGGIRTAVSNQHVLDHAVCLPTDSSNAIYRGKNAYALSVLRQVETKIEGLDLEDNRKITLSEQVDHLIQQATNIDNLCNMYEGLETSTISRFGCFDDSRVVAQVQSVYIDEAEQWLPQIQQKKISRLKNKQTQQSD